CATSEHDPRVNLITHGRGIDHLLCHHEDLLETRFCNFAQESTISRSAGVFQYVRNFDDFVRVNSLNKSMSVLLFHVLRIKPRNLEAVRDVVRYIVAAERDYAAVLDAATGENGNITSTAANIDEQNAEVFFIIAEDRERRRE